MNDPQSQYKETQILTASPEKLLLMLYDAAIVALEKAVEELSGSKRYDKVNEQLLKAQEIVGELMATLDLEKGGEIATNLQSLYAYFLQKIMKGNLEKDIIPINEVLKFMQELQEGWRIAVANNQSVEKESKAVYRAEDSENQGSSGFNISG